MEESLNNRERDPSTSLRFARDDSQKLLSIFGHIEIIAVITLNEFINHRKNMSEKNPGYNPEGLSEEELKKIDEEAAAKREERLEGLQNQNLKLKLKKKIRKGLGVHRSAHFLPDKDETEDKETDSNGLIRKINNLVKKYKKSYGLDGRFGVTEKTDGEYKLDFTLVKLGRSLKDGTEVIFEGTAEKVIHDLTEYLKDAYDDKL